MAVVDSATAGNARERTREIAADARALAGTVVACSAGDEMTRRRVRAVLAREGFGIAAVTATVGELLEASLGVPVDALVLACDRGVLDHPSELQLLRSDLPASPIVVVCAAEGRRPVRKALAAGADGYVREAGIEEALALTIQAVCAGQVCVPGDVRDVLGKPAFSFREKQVLHLVARGCTNGEIARALFLAESTVKSHLSSSFRKLGVGSRKEAAAIVLDPDNGLNLEILGGVAAAEAAGAPAGD